MEESHKITRKFTSSSPTTLELPLKNLDTDSQRGTLKNGLDPSILFWKAKVLHVAHCKTKQSHIWEDVNHDGHRSKLWDYKPPLRPTPIRAALEIARQIIHTVRETCQPVITNERVHGPGWTLDSFIKNKLDRNYLKPLKPLHID